jgi:hypothetical protein
MSIIIYIVMFFTSWSTCCYCCSAFLLPSPFQKVSRRSKQKRVLFGLSEWRSRGNPTNGIDNNNDNRTLLMLPFAIDQALMVPGQSLSIVLKEGRYIDLLEQATAPEEDHCHIIGGVIMGEDSLLPIVPLCEIVSFTFDAEYRGKITATLTLKCVGRAQLDAIQQLKPYVQGTACEVKDNSDDFDKFNNHLEACNDIIQDIEQTATLRNSSNNAMYQQTFWMALTALDYSTTSLLTRDPISTNSQKEVEAASWAALSLLSNPMIRYQAMACNTVLERLQVARRGLLQESLIQTSFASSSSSASETANESDCNDDQSGFQ